MTAAAPPAAAADPPFDGQQHPVRTLARLLTAHRGRLTVAMIAFTIKDSPLWLIPLLTANVIDIVVQHQPLFHLWIDAALLAVVLLQNIPVGTLWAAQSSIVIRQLAVRLRSALTSRLQELSIGFHTRTGPSMLQNKVIRDVENVELMLQQVFASGTSAVLTLAGALTMTAIKVPEFVPLFLLVAPASAALIAMVRRRSRVRNEQFRRRVEQLSARVNEMAHLMPITRAHALEQAALQRVRGSVEEVGAAGQRLDLVNGRLGATSWVTYQVLGAACLIGAGWAAYTKFFAVSAGDVVLLSSYFALLTSSVVQLFGLAPILTRGVESIRSIGEVLQAPDIEHNEGKQVVATVGGAVELRGLTFTFDEQDTPALADLDLTVEPGETLAVVGPSGAGKSTLLNLLLGFIRPTEGTILLDGVPMEQIDLRSYRRFLSVVPQESHLFDGTVRENVTYGMTGIDDRTVLAALRDANALEFVERFPEGWDTLLGERGARLSGGQKQRLAIARALVRNPRVLLLDEATSALDSQSEALVQEALERLMAGRTTFVVAHRLSTIRTATRVAVLSRGRLVELGTHNELIAAGGLYAKLYATQAA
jgi:ATP-binding cassette subfamily B protein